MSKQIKILTLFVMIHLLIVACGGSSEAPLLLEQKNSGDVVQLDNQEKVPEDNETLPTASPTVQQDTEQSPLDSVFAYNNRGLAHYDRGDLEAAIADYNRAIDLVPDIGRVYYNRGLAYYDQGDFVAAVADYTRSIELEPSYVNVYNNRGLAYYDQGDFVAAMADYDEAIERDPLNVLAYYNRGLVHVALQDVEAAIADYSRAIELSPTEAFAYYNRGGAYYRQGELEKAVADFKSYLQFDPNASDREEVMGLIESIQAEMTQQAVYRQCLRGL